MTALWAENPSFDCLARGHIWVDVPGGGVTTSWCVWCGTGVVLDD
jgi:hypothetical protein